MTEPTKRSWIREIVPGKTFADIGGLGGNSINEMVTEAIEGGATEATLVDVVPATHPLWDSFHEICTRKNITTYKTLVADLNEMDGGTDGLYDVVHCSGILYHVPDPIHMLWQLRKITSETLILTSATVPPLVKNKKGEARLTPGKALFVPAVSGPEVAVYAQHFETLGMSLELFDGSSPQWISNNYTTVNYGPWWWLFTEDYIYRMLEVVGLRVRKKEETWKDRGWSYLCDRIR